MSKSIYWMFLSFITIAFFLSSCQSRVLQPENHSKTKYAIESKKHRVNSVISLDEKHQILLHFHQVKNRIKALEIVYTSHVSSSSFLSCGCNNETNCDSTQKPITDQTTEPIFSPITDLIPEPIIDETTETIIDETSEPIIDETTETIIDQTTEQIIDETSEPITDQTTEPIIDETTEPIIDETSEPIIDETTETIIDETSEPITDQTIETIIDETTEPIIDETTEQIIDETSEPITDQTTETIINETSEPITDQTTETIIDETTEQLIDETTQSIIEETTDSMTDQTTETIIDETSEPITDQTTETIIDETKQPIIDETSEPITDLTPEPIDDQTREPITDPISEPIIDETTEKLCNVVTIEKKNITRPHCDLSIKKVIQLEAKIKSSFEKHNQTYDFKCFIDANNSDGACNELITNMDCVINSLISKFQNESDNVENVIKIINQYEIIRIKFHWFLDEYKHVFLVEDGTKIYELIVELQALQTRIDAIRYKILQGSLESIKYFISMNSSTEALDFFMNVVYAKLDVKFLIENVVRQSFSLETISTIINFLNSLPIHSYTVIGYEVLYEMIQLNRQMDSQKYIIYIHDMIVWNLTDVTGHEEFRESINVIYHEIVNQTVTIILKNSDCTVLNSLTTNEHYFISIVMGIYRNVTDVEFLLRCISKMPHDDSITTLKVLYEELLCKNETDSLQWITIARNVMLVMKSKKFNLLDEKYTIKFEEYKASLPKSIRCLIWSKNNCYLSNVGWHEYLYAADRDNNYRNVFTAGGSKSNAGLWRFRQVKPTNAYAIISEYYKNQYMFTSDEFFGANETNWVRVNEQGKFNDIGGYWIFEPNRNEDTLKIRNVKFNKYLYASNTAEHHQMRDVYVGKFGEVEDEADFDWKITCN